jgi:hypothetical protein
MHDGQDWCLQCGAGAPGSLGAPGWRSGATILLATVVLALGAAVAAYAALNKSTPKAQTVTTTVAQATPPAATTPATPTTTTPGAATVPKTVKPVKPLGKTTPPKIPLTATPTPKSSTTSPSTTPTKTSTTPTTTAGSETGSSSESTEVEPTPILLDTNAASTYNPYAYPVSEFGDPSLTIDGDSSTAWTAQVEAATAPKMAEGVLVNLKSGQKISKLKLITSTPGITVQIYGAHGATLPSSITDAAWIPLSHSQVIKKRHATIKLRDASRSFTYVTLWISKAPSTSTPQAPGHVSINEIELFPTE